MYQYNDELCASEDSVVMLCDPCSFDSLQEESRAFCQNCNEFLCHNCLRSHRKFQAFRQHHILHGDSMPRTKGGKALKLELKLCDNHQMNEVQFYCINHECVFCSLCKVAKHSRCDYKQIEELISVSEDQEKLEKAAKKINAIKSDFEQLKEVQIEKIDFMSAISKVQKDHLDSIRKEMTMFFDRLANEINEHEEKRKTHIKEMKGDVQICTDVINHIDSLKENIRNVSQSNDRVAIFSADCKLEKIVEEYEVLKDNISPGQIPEQSKDITQKLIKVKDLVKSIEEKVNVKQTSGANQSEKEKTVENLSNKNEITTTDITNEETKYKTTEGKNDNFLRKVADSASKASGTQCETNTDIETEKLNQFENKSTATKISETKAQMMSFYNLRQTSVTYKSINIDRSNFTRDITGSLFLPDGSLILCDHGNSELILLDRNFEILDQLIFEGNLWDVALLNNYEIILSLKYSKLLKFLYVESGRLHEWKRMDLKMVPWGVATYQKKKYVLVTFHNNPGKGFIEVREASGKIVRTIGDNKSEEELFSSPFYVTVNQHNGDIYVSDSRKNSLICLSIYGKVLYTVKCDKLDWPRKVIVDDFGNSLLCASLANRLLLVPNKTKSSDASNQQVVDMKVMFKDCYRPQTVSMRWEDQTIVLGINMSNNIQVIKFVFNSQ